MAEDLQFMKSGIVIIIGLVAVLGVLLFGILSMLSGGDFNRKYANKMMRLRILLQLLVILLIGLLLWLGD